MQAGPRPSHCSIALPSSSSSGFLSIWSHSQIMFLPLSELTPSQRHFYQSRGKGEARIWGGFKGLGKNLPLGISFLHLPGINCPMEMEALQLGEELLRAKHVEAATLLVPPRCRNWVLKGPGRGGESALSRGPMPG